MQQLILNVGTGETEVVEAPVPALRAGHVLVQTQCSLISTGTERMLVDFGRASLIEKARQQPDKVRMVLDKMRTDGVLTAIEATRSKLEQPVALGYCNVGTVLSVGAGVTQFRCGDRVVSNGGHASVVSVPVNLCARIPDEVSDESAAFTILGAIGLQGIRLAQPTIGESVVVTGLGIIGILTVQMLRAHGCRVLGIDPDPSRLELAARLGAAVINPSADDVVPRALEFSRNRGVDAVIITASTKSSDPVSQAAKMCRKRGRIVLVGVTGLELSRQDFYEKEITFQVSCSYGPGRYDETYERNGHDYPFGFVRWTEQRNFEAVLDLMVSGSLNVKPLVSHHFPIERADEAYSLLTDGGQALGVILQYSQPDDATSQKARTVVLDGSKVLVSAIPRSPVVGCIGAGNYGGRVLLPALASTGAQLHTLVTSQGLNSVHYGKKFGFARASTSTEELFGRSEINTVIISTRHDSHAQFATQALRSGRHVYVEKPLAISHPQLAEVHDAYFHGIRDGASPILMVGFNRRFSPHIRRMKELLRSVAGPKSLTMLMNAGAIPSTHWTQDPSIGGDRIVGEACHFIDLARFLVGSPIRDVSATAMRSGDALIDTAQISLEFQDGSIAAIQYYANGHRSFPKERVEVFASGRILQLDNFRVLRVFGWPGIRGLRTLKQDKGQVACIQAFIDAVKAGQTSPIPADEVFEVSKVAIEVAHGLSAR